MSVRKRCVTRFHEFRLVTNRKRLHPYLYNKEYLYFYLYFYGNGQIKTIFNSVVSYLFFIFASQFISLQEMNKVPLCGRLKKRYKYV